MSIKDLLRPETIVKLNALKEDIKAIRSDETRAMFEVRVLSRMIDEKRSEIRALQSQRRKVLNGYARICEQQRNDSRSSGDSTGDLFDPRSNNFNNERS